MRVGVIVDGQSEFRSLRFLLDQVDMPHEIVSILKADIQPLAPAKRISNTVLSKVPILRQRGAQIVLVVFDLEDNSMCAGSRASEIMNLLSLSEYTALTFKVVIKNLCYENWLIADIQAMKTLSGRFDSRKISSRKIFPNKADNVPALKMLKSAAKNTSYDKVADSCRIAKCADPLEVAKNSRSFRKLLRELDHPLYEAQSRNPAN